jgi:Dipeptidyl aminopeptidases/acylaminoacyl-peptidases
MMNKKKYVLFLCIAVALVLLGSLGAYLVHTSGCTVKITDMTYVTEDGARMSALLYVPNSVSVENPAPAIVSIHGYNNTREVQDINAVELSRRGYVVIAIDSYDHGGSSFADPRINKGVAPDMGAYSALQYLGTLPYVDAKRIGMVGHSLGGSNVQLGALRAFAKQEKNSAIIVPKVVVPTSQAFIPNKEVTDMLLNKYPVNVCAVFGRFDEWANNMWQVRSGIDINMSKKAIAAMGFPGAEYGAYYTVGINKKLTREEAIATAAEGKLRVIYQPQIEHPKIHFSTVAVGYILDAFDITLKGGKEILPTTEQSWPWKQFFTLLVMIGFFLFVIPFAFLMLEIPYFKTIIQPEPVAPSIMTTAKNKIIYWIIFIICLLPAPLLFNWAIGYPIAIKSMDRFVPTVFPLNSYFQLPCVNGTVLLMLLVGAILLAVFIATYFLFMKKNKVAFDNLGVRMSGGNIGKSILLALIIFVATYFLLVIADFFFLSDARFWVFSIKTLTPIKFWILLKYLPFFLFFYLINSLLLNSFTRIRGASEGTNIVLMILANIGGLAVLTILDYTWLFSTGVKLFPSVPFPPNMTSALAGLFVWNFILAVSLAAVSARLFFKKTGSIWLGGFVNSLIVTLFSISNTVAGAGII